MNLTKQSEVLMSFFLEKKCMKPVVQTKKTDTLLKQLYSDIVAAEQFVHNKKLKDGRRFYDFKSSKITNISQIPKPKTFNANSFPIKVRNHIDTTASHVLSYTFSLMERIITIHFVLEHMTKGLKLELYNQYIDKILIWLHIANEYSTKPCAKTMTLYIYLTSLTKELPNSNIDILGEDHVNTAFTYTCPVNSEIVIYRKEEWFKVFIHETFHNLALDFSDMNIETSTQKILSLFPVKSDVTLFEAYTETWAEIMNVAFCSYHFQSSNELEFLKNFDFFINYERSYSFFQMVKTIHFMGLTYKDLYSKSVQSTSMRETLYNEKSNVLSYYIIKTILMNNYQGFLSWCDTNNLSLLQFKKTPSNIAEFCKFIGANYKTKPMLANVSCMESFLFRLKGDGNNGPTKKNNKDNLYILNNMRMSIAEMG